MTALKVQAPKARRARTAKAARIRDGKGKGNYGKDRGQQTWQGGYPQQYDKGKGKGRGAGGDWQGKGVRSQQRGPPGLSVSVHTCVWCSKTHPRGSDGCWWKPGRKANAAQNVSQQQPAQQPPQQQICQQPRRLLFSAAAAAVAAAIASAVART